MSKNNITGDTLVTKPSNEQYDSGWDAIWGKPHCNRCGKKLGDKDHIHTCTPKGYTEEELDADNPYNNWMNEK